MQYSDFFYSFRRSVSVMLVVLLVWFSSGLTQLVPQAEAAGWVDGENLVYNASTLEYGDSIWLATLNGSDYATSNNNGVSWTKTYTPLPSAILATKYVNGTWYAVGDEGYIAATTNISNWGSPKVTNTSSMLSDIAVRESPLKLVVTGWDGTVITSANGNDWGNRTPSEVSMLSSVTYGESKFLAVGADADGANAIYTSADGEEWDIVPTASPVQFLNKVAFGNGQFVAVGAAGYIYTSDNGTDWDEPSFPASISAVDLVSVSFGEGKFYAAGLNGTVISSSNGSTWSEETSGGVKQFSAVKAAGGKVVAVGEGGLVKYSNAALSSNNDLKDLKITPGTLSFNAATTTYNVSVPYGTPKVTVTPEVDDPGATVKVAGTAPTPVTGGPVEVNLEADGSTDITVEVTAADSTKKSYVIKVTEEAASANADLSNIGLSTGTLTPSPFAAATPNYTVNVPENQSSVTITPSKADSTSTMTINGVEQASIAVSLNKGETKLVTVVVTAQDGIANRTYNLTVTRAQSTDATLQQLGAAGGTVTPAVFNPAVETYTVDLPFETAEATFTPVLNDANATLEVTGQTDFDNVDTYTKSVNPGGTATITFKVTAQDTFTTKTYTVTVNRALSPDADLLTLGMTGGSLSPAVFDPDHLTYSVNLPYANGTVEFTPEKSNPLAQLVVDGAEFDGVDTYSLDLIPNEERTITFRVIAEDTSKTKTYTVTVKRDPSPNADLRDLEVIAGSEMEEEFAPNTITYTIKLPYAESKVGLKPTLDDAYATLDEVTGAVPEGDSYVHSLNPGDSHTIRFVVKAQSGAEKTYTVNVSRERSPHAKMQDLDVTTGGALNETFNPALETYTVDLPYAQTKVGLKPTLDAYATVAVTGADPEGDSYTKSVNPGQTVTIQFTVTSQDGQNHTTYTVNVTRERSPIADLSNIEVTAGPALRESFSSAVTEYHIDLPYSTEKVGLKPVLADGYATFEVVNADLEAGSYTKSLTPGQIVTIEFIVTAQDSTEKTYKVIVERAKSPNADLRELKVLGGGALSEAFDPADTTLTVNLPYEVTGVALQPVLDDAPYSSFTVTGADLVDGAYTKPVDPGQTITITITVTAQNGIEKTYTVSVKRPFSPNADLRSLTVAGGPVAPADFDPDVLSYTVTLPYETDTVELTPALDHDKATLEVEGAEDDGTGKYSRTFDPGEERDVTFKVTAEDTVNTKTYTVKVKRTASPKKDLTDLQVTTGEPLQETFDRDRLAYTIKLPYEQSKVGLKPTLEDPVYATLDVNEATPEDDSYVRELIPGEEVTIEFVVTAQDTTVKTYTVTVTREPSSNNNLSNLEVTLGEPLNVPFAAGTLAYTIELPYEQSKTSLKPTLADPYATLSVLRAEPDGDAYTSELLPNETVTIEFTVTAQDESEQTYTVTVHRAASPHGKLQGLDVTAGGSLTEGFDPDTLEYTVNLPYAQSKVGLKPTLDDYATVEVTGAEQEGDSYVKELLPNGTAVIEFTVTSQDTQNQTTYKVTVKRAPSPNKDLRDLEVTQGEPLSQDFAPGVTAYTINLPYEQSKAGLKPTLDDDYATLAVTGATLEDGSYTAELIPNQTVTIDFVVTAQDTTQQTYRVTVTRAPSPIADLSDLEVTGGGYLTEEFDPADETHTLTLPYEVGKAIMKPVLADEYATFAVTGAVTEGETYTKELLPGESATVEIVVTAQNSSTKTYVITVTRELASTDATLSNLSVDTGKLTPDFASNVDTYTVAVPYSVSTLNVTPTLNYGGAALKVNGTLRVSGNAVPVALNVGPNTITVLVTAQDGVTTQEYKITVTRAAYVPPVDDKVKGTLQGNITKLIGNGNKLSADVYSPDGKTLLQAGVDIIGANGKFELKKIEPGSYRMVIYVIGDNGTKLAGQTAMLSVNANKEASASASVIDPFGVVTDAISKKAVDGVNVTVYWADTALNNAQGRTPGAKVELPRLSPMTNKNANGQTTGKDGGFGWLLLPEGDYYIVAEKEGYEQYDGRNAVLHVGQSAVQTNITLQPKVLEEGVIEPYITGYPDGTFKPNKGITRAELASILLRVINIKAETSTSGYSDVSASNWAAPAIAEVTKRGLMVGYPDGTFQPNKEMSRAEIAVVLGKVRDLSDKPEKSSFTDIDQHWAKNAILLAEQAGLLSGHTDGKFRPDNALTRAEAVVIFNKVLGWNDLNVDKPQRWSDVPKNYWAYKDIMRASVPHAYQKLGNGMVIWK